MTDNEISMIAGIIKATVAMCRESDMLSRREAQKVYGRYNLDAWYSKGLIKPRRSGIAANSKMMYNRAELEMAQKLSTI